MPSSVPILFLIFNRPDKTARVFEAIREHQPKRLYVASDGPRSNMAEEAKLCEKTRAIATKVDWDCEVKTLFRGDNLGVREAVSGAIDWFFETELEGIVLEDDCLPHPSFFEFCRELLERFSQDDRVMSITGDNFTKGYRHGNDSYFFSRYSHMWGWATWRRAWLHYDRDLEMWHGLKDQDFFKRMEPRNPLFRWYWQRIFERVEESSLDSWAYTWMFSCWAADGLTCTPSVNLVSNIGFDQRGTHTQTSAWYADLPASAIEFPLVHPEVVGRDTIADNRVDKYRWEINLRRVVLQQVKKRYHRLIGKTKQT